MASASRFSRYEIPLYGRATLECDVALVATFFDAVNTGLARAGDPFPHTNLQEAPNFHRGLIASGDRFACDPDDVDCMRADLRSADHLPLAVQMEGAAAAQVGFDDGIPLIGMRILSDRADAHAYTDFSAFVQQVISHYALAIVSHFRGNLLNQ